MPFAAVDRPKRVLPPPVIPARAEAGDIAASPRKPVVAAPRAARPCAVSGRSSLRPAANNRFLLLAV